MTDPADQPDDDTAADADEAALKYAHEVGTAMVEQLGVLLDRWVVQISQLVDHGIDPSPLLQGLARLMRSAADQLDPEVPTEPDSTDSAD